MKVSNGYIPITPLIVPKGTKWSTVPGRVEIFPAPRRGKARRAEKSTLNDKRAI